MKKTFRIIGMAMMAVLLSLSLAACGSDNEPADPETHDPNLIGTWVHEDSGDYWSEKTEVTFKKNGRWELQESYWDEDGKEKYWSKGNWETAGNTLYLEQTSSSDGKDDGKTFSMHYSVSGKTLYIDDEEFTRK